MNNDELDIKAAKVLDTLRKLESVQSQQRVATLQAQKKSEDLLRLYFQKMKEEKSDHERKAWLFAVGAAIYAYEVASSSHSAMLGSFSFSRAIGFKLFKLERAWLDASGRFFRVPREHQGKGNKAVPAFVVLDTAEQPS